MLIYVDKKKFRIIKKKPRSAVKTGETKSSYFYIMGGGKRLIKAKKGNQLRYTN